MAVVPTAVSQLSVLSGMEAYLGAVVFPYRLNTSRSTVDLGLCAGTATASKIVRSAC